MSGRSTLFCTSVRYCSTHDSSGVPMSPRWRLAPPAIFYFLPLVRDAHGQVGAHDGQANGAAPRAHQLACGLARALGGAAVARELAALDARRQVGAAALNVGARLGREALARKLGLAVVPVVARHVTQVVHARALRARGIGRADGDTAALGHAVGAHLEQLLAQLAVGGHGVDFAVPICQVWMRGRVQGDGHDCWSGLRGRAHIRKSRVRAPSACRSRGT